MKNSHVPTYSEEFKMLVLIDHYSIGLSVSFTCEKYNLSRATFYRWLEHYPFEKILLSLSSDQQKEFMTTQKKNTDARSVQELESRIKDLEKALALSNLRAHALDRMIDIAEEMEGIKIRKKPGTKQ